MAKKKKNTFTRSQINYILLDTMNLTERKNTKWDIYPKCRKYSYLDKININFYFYFGITIRN